MLGYFAKRPVIEWGVPPGNEPRKGILDGVLPLAQQVELQQRAAGMAIYRSAEQDGRRVGLDPVLRAHLGLERRR